MDKGIIQNVSDTALWVAAFRAKESERKDAVFKDPLARKLCGEKGFRIAASTPRYYRRIIAFIMTVRTHAIDALIEHAISKGIDTVINMGAGLDTRPYRMKLPKSLKWIEVDLQGIIDYKNKQLKDEKPVCELQRITADLSDDAQREQLFARLNHATSKALVITEGLIPYLSNEQAAALSVSIYKIPSFYFWIQDYSQGDGLRRRRTRGMKKMLENAPFLFSEEDPINFFGRDGWKVCENKYILDEADSIGRSFPLRFPWNIFARFSPGKVHQSVNKMYGYVMFCRS